MLNQVGKEMSPALRTYCKGFSHGSQDWPPLPLVDRPELDWWRRLIGNSANGITQGRGLLSALEQSMPQLRLPQQEGISGREIYKMLVLRDEAADAAMLAAAGPPLQWERAEALKLWIAPHPCGAMPVLQTPSWHDFLQLVRALAHRCEPIQLDDGVHAQAISGLIHWGLIREFGRQSRARLIVLHEAPYGSVLANALPVDLSKSQWLAASTALRLEHELTHLATKRLLGEMRLNLLDELIADCMGMVAALGWFNAGLFGRCLGIDAEQGRWSTYTKELSESDARQAVASVMARSYELDQMLSDYPWLLQPAQAMQRLQWLSTQRLDQTISPPPAIRN